MQSSYSSHNENANLWHPPEHVAKKLIKQAIRKIPGHESLMDKCYPKNLKTNQLPPHVYNNGGRLQWAFN